MVYRRVLKSIGLLVSLLLLSGGLAAQIPNPHVDREVIVMFKPAAARLVATSATLPEQGGIEGMPALSEVLSRHGVSSIRRAFPDLPAAASSRVESQEGLRRVYVLQAAKAADRKALIRELLELPEVLYAEPNGMAVARVTPNDTHYTKQWNLENLAQAGGLSDADIDADLAWDVTTGSSVTIGIVDVGRVLQTHPDLSGRVSGNLSTPVHDHSTHVAGIAAAKGNNNAGIAGVNWNALINTQTVGDLPTTAAAVRAAISAGARVINNSWGQVPAGFSTTVAWAFADAYESNVISCNAMPETGSSQDEPNIYGQGNLNVAASTTSDTKASYSIARSYVDVMAPGGNNDGNALHNILSTVPATTAYGQYDFKPGTSMAAPHVAGIASLLLSYRPGLYNDDVEKLVQISADKVAAMNGQSFTQDHGHGRANARRALDYLRAPYELVQRTATGGTDFSSTATYSLVFFGAPGLADGTYFVKRHEVRKTVSFPPYNSPQVWGRGLATTGWSNTSPHFGTPWSEVVPGTVTSTSATLRTNLYEVWTTGGTYLGWKPTSPANATFGYTTWGVPTPFIVNASAPGYITQKATYQLTGSANVAATNWKWERSDDGGPWSVWATTQNSQFVAYGGDYTIQWRLTATRVSDGRVDTDTATTVVCTLTSGCGPIP